VRLRLTKIDEYQLAKARFGASAAYLLNEAASLALVPLDLSGTDRRRRQGVPVP
jgi:hypothetical protein